MSPSSRSSSLVNGILRVDLATTTGPVHGGASGMLYGLGEPGIPAQPLVEGARPRTVSQKAPGGAQHPTGDALETAEGFFAAGGSEMHVYLQDAYAQWPYENVGISDYLEKVEAIVSRVAASPHAERFVWVPFNEPDWIWYSDWSADRERFFADWAAIRTLIRQILPEARLVGPNEMVYSHDRLADFLTWAASTDQLPDLVSWHELKPEGLAEYRDHHADYRAIIAELGVAPIPVIINEYGNRRDFANPAQVVQWLAMFEETKVDANMAFWTAAGNLDDHTVGVQQANGGWWLLAWYADLSGETVRVVPPQPATIDTLQGIAALDRQRRQLDVLLGGTGLAPVVELDGLSRELFGETVDVVVRRTTWSGYEGDAGVPPVISRQRSRLGPGLLRIEVPDADPMAAYRVTVTPAEGPVGPLLVAWSTRIEAEHGVLSDAVVVARDGDPQEYATSGARDVDVSPGGSVELTVEVPTHGRYRLGIFYGTSGVRGKLGIRIGDRPEEVVDLPATLTAAHRGRVDHEVDLDTGRTVISLQSRMSSADVLSLDRLDVSTGPEGVDRQRHDARSLRLSGGARLRPGTPDEPPSVVLAGGLATAFVATRFEGYYDVDVIAVDSPGRLALGVGDRSAAAFDVTSEARLRCRVHLARGVSAVRLSGDAEVVEVAITPASTPATPHPSPLVVLDADSGATVTIGRETSPSPGSYDLSLDFGNDARESGHEYNTDVRSVTIEIAEERGGTVRQALPYTAAADNLWRVVVPLELTTSDGALTIRALTGAPTVGTISVTPFVPHDG